MWTWSWRTYEMHSVSFLNRVWQELAWPKLHAKGGRQMPPGGAERPLLGRSAWGLCHLAPPFWWTLSGGRPWSLLDVSFGGTRSETHAPRPSGLREARQPTSGACQPSVLPTLHVDAWYWSRDGYHWHMLRLTLTYGPFDPCPCLSDPLIESSSNPWFRGIVYVSRCSYNEDARLYVGVSGRPARERSGGLAFLSIFGMCSPASTTHPKLMELIRIK